jgi:rhodanese-related sulfurtransferase
MSETTLRWIAGLALLAGHGFADVHVVQGGMTAWLGNGWPVEDANPKPE